MPKNKGKGGKNRRRGKNENESTKRDLTLKEEGQEYALVLSLLGNVKLDLKCFDGVRRIGLIRGKLRKKVWISVNDVVLVSIRQFQDNFCDVIAKYNADEVRQLKNIGHITDVAEEQKNEVIKFSMEGKVTLDSEEEDILSDIMGMRNLNRPTQEMLDGIGSGSSDEDSDDESDEDSDEESDEESEDEEEEEESEEDVKTKNKQKSANYKQNSNTSKTAQQLEMEKILAGMDINPVKVEKDYSLNKVKTKTSTFSDMVDRDDDEEDEEEEAEKEAAQITNDELMNKLNMFQNSIKGLRINKKSSKK